MVSVVLPSAFLSLLVTKCISMEISLIVPVQQVKADFVVLVIAMAVVVEYGRSYFRFHYETFAVVSCLLTYYILLMVSNLVP